MLIKVKCFIVISMVGLMVGITIGASNQAQAQSYIEELENSWVQPVNGKITDTFGTRNGKHKGIDIAAPEGEKIVSVSDGKVTKSYYSDTYGHVVFVGHPEGYETVYAHLSKRMVSVGESVKKGQALGIIGNTGVSRGTHLHFELHDGEWTYGKEHALDPFFVFELPNATVRTEQVQQELEGAQKKQKAVKIETQSITVEKAVGERQERTDLQKKVITVNKGDTLWKLSQNYHVTIKSLQEWNRLKSNTIHQGQELTVYLNKENSYVVKSGDTIHSIAKEYKVEPEKIIKVNELNNDKLFPKQVLLINKN